ncbi:MAG TPA: GNAT family N-acetyltransferase [Candidatus Binataceae bacterium]|nr:GNAT family N-acetyltransferase [Candidatus Binataceae bacterium]
MATAAIKIAQSDAEIRSCFPVMRELRTHLEPDSFVARVRLQEREGYRLAFLEENGAVSSVAGFRYLENLASGRVLYVDDLVTAPDRRSGGSGGKLFDWLVEQARARGCATLELDSGVQRFGAHRFYLRRRMNISSHHFRLPLDESP